MIEKVVVPKSCFVVSPIGNANSDTRQHADWLLNGIVRPALAELFDEARILRADEDHDPGMINNQVIKRIIESDLVIADLSELNPNVFYEIGIRHAVRKPIIHVAKSDTKLPFDNAGQKTIFFNILNHTSVQNAINQIRLASKQAMSPDFQVSNPYISAINSITLSQSGDPKDKIIADLTERMDHLDRKLSHSANLPQYLGGNSQEERLFSVVSNFISRSKIRVENIDHVINSIINSKQYYKFMDLYGKNKDAELAGFIRLHDDIPF